MLHQFRLALSAPVLPRFHPSWGTTFHGLLTQRLSPEMQARIHGADMRPFAQYLRGVEEGQVIWQINTWDDAFASALMDAFRPGDAFTLAQKQLSLTLNQVIHQAVTEADWCLSFFTDAQINRVFEVTFHTPCSHKRDGGYLIFPDTEVMMRGLWRKLCMVPTSMDLDDRAAMDACAQSVQISGYKLRTAPFDLEGIRLNCFTGKLILYLRGNPQLVRLSAMVLSFANYCGIGIKTALGMGGCTVSPLPPKAP